MVVEKAKPCYSCDSYHENSNDGAELFANPDAK